MAFGLILNAPQTTIRKIVVVGLAVLGITISVLTLQGVINASNAISETHNWWHSRIRGADASHTPPLIYKPKFFSDSRATSWGTPILTMVIWLILLIWVLTA